MDCHSNGSDGPDKFTTFYYAQKDMHLKKGKVIVEMNVQITCLSEKEPRK